MDRQKKRNAYGSSGTAYNYVQNDKKKSKKNQKSGWLRRGSLVVILLVMLFLIWGLIKQGKGRQYVGKVMRIGATLSQNVTPFGNSVIFYDGTTLHCMSANGDNEWSYQIGTNADYDATENRIVAWSGNDLYILNNRGRLIYNNKMSDEIQFARAGNTYVAVFVGKMDMGVISVINESGQIVDNIAINNSALMDIGFFNTVTTGSTQQTELMWTLELDTTGTVISMQMQTFQPGKLATGKTTLGEHIAYKVYGLDGGLEVVTTRQIMHYNYRALEQADPTLIYGYTVEQVKQVGKTVYQLLVPVQESRDGIKLNNVRLVYRDVDRVLHLPEACMSAALGTHSVYGFSESAVYVCPFGETTFQSYPMPIRVTAMLGMISDNRAILASGSDIYVVELPR